MPLTQKSLRPGWMEQMSPSGISRETMLAIALLGCPTTVGMGGAAVATNVKSQPPNSAQASAIEVRTIDQSRMNL